MVKKYTPIKISDADRTFGGKAMKILPPYSAIPDEFKRNGNAWERWASSWFYEGLKQYPIPKDGIDLTDALANLACVMRSFEPKHEHKTAGAAFLASQWFSSPDGPPV